MRLRFTCLAFCALGSLASSVSADEFRLSFPLQCKLHETCFIQNYVDIDPSRGVQDYFCSRSTYDGHKGTDIRLVSVAAAKKGVPVIAAAAGRVTAIRNGMEDRLLSGQETSPKGMECGNGVVIDHGGGWETQYCHMRRGSVQVQPGQIVERGQALGLVGYSGKTQFAHLHLSVRKGGHVIDPFTGGRVESHCGGGGNNALWEARTREALKYQHGELIEAGFADKPVKSRDLENGLPESTRPSPVSRAIVFYVRLINLKKGDRINLTLSGPSGTLAQNTTKPLDRHKAQYVAYIGRKLRTKRWPVGKYEGRLNLRRSGATILQERIVLDIP